MFPGIKNAKVLDSVVAFDAVDVVYLFRWFEAASQMLLNNPSVFEDTSAVNSDATIPMRVYHSARGIMARP